MLTLGKWNQPGVPHRGWICIGVEDLEEPSAVCAMCETQSIRYVHTMEHPEYPDTLDCGCVCAGHMEEDYEGARRREATLRNTITRRRKWLQRRWQSSSIGNPYLNANGYNVVVFPRFGAWAFKVTNRETDDSLTSRWPLPTSDAAKLRAFDAILWMQERGR